MKKLRKGCKYACLLAVLLVGLYYLGECLYIRYSYGVFMNNIDHAAQLQEGGASP